MLLLAATALEKASQVPSSFWLKLALGIIAFIVVVILLRKLAQVNKVVLFIVSIIIAGIVGFQWIYERNEPAFLTPVVDAIAPFFPSKGAYENTQSSEPARPKSKRSTAPNK